MPEFRSNLATTTASLTFNRSLWFRRSHNCSEHILTVADTFHSLLGSYASGLGFLRVPHASLLQCMCSIIRFRTLNLSLDPVSQSNRRNSLERDTVRTNKLLRR